MSKFGRSKNIEDSIKDYHRNIFYTKSSNCKVNENASLGAMDILKIGIKI